jgi:hypothetical protein
MSSDEGELGLIEQQIQGWVRENVLYPEKKLHGTCDHVMLRHVNVERKPQGDVKAFPVRLEEGAEDDGLIPLLHKIAEAAQGDADDMNQGVQSYALYAYYPAHKGYVPRRFFRVAPSDVEIQRDLAPSEPPTEKGLVAQMQRHVEAIMRTSTIANGHLFQTMQNEMRRLAEMNEKFATQQIDFMVLTQDLIDNSHGRRLKEKDAETNLAMKESALSKIEALVPVILNRLAGKQILPEENRSLMLMAALMENMSEAQQLQFYGSLNDPQKMALAEILAEYEKGKSRLHRDNPVVKIGAKNELPPAKKNNADEGVLVDPSEVRPMSSALVLSERLRLPIGPSSDPKIQQLEGDAQTFASRFRDMLGTAKKTPTGETK